MSNPKKTASVIIDTNVPKTAFDISDRKFIAVANAHPAKPPIFEATDSKWWGWKKALEEAGIEVNFLCPDYIKAKYRKKMEKSSIRILNFLLHLI